MKKLLLLFSVLAALAHADTPPATVITKLKGSATNGLIQQVSTVVGALNCGSNVDYAPLWTGTQFTCQPLPASGVSDVTGVSPIASSGGSTPAISLIDGNNAGDAIVWDGGGWTPTPVVSDVSADAPLVSTGGTTPSLSIPEANSEADGYLSSGDWGIFNGKQDALVIGNLTDAGTDGIVITGGTGAVIGTGAALSQHVSDATHNGYLSSANFTAFNGKQAAGNYITALTGDVTASGPGSSAATLASTAVTPGSYTNTNLTVDAKGRITAASNGSGGSGTVSTVSVASANGFAGTVANPTTTPAITLTTSITGVLKGNGTAISAATSGTDYSAGTSALATGIVKSTTTTGALTIAVAADFPTLNQNTTGTAANATNVATTATNSTNASFFPTFVASGTGGNQGIDTATGLTFNPSTNLLALGGGGLFQSTNSTETVACGMSASNRFSCNNNTHASSTFLTFATNTSYLGLGIGTFSNDWYISILNASSDTTPLASLTPNTGTPSLLDIRNSSATAGNWGALIFSGSTDKATSFAYGVTTVHTASSETGELHLGTTTAGTRIDDLILRAKGQVTYVGTAPAAGTCGTSPGTPTGSDNVFKITSGSGGVSSTCAVTLATTPTTGGHCNCRDQTTPASFTVDANVSGSTVTMTTYSRTTGLVANFTASDVFSCACSYF